MRLEDGKFVHTDPKAGIRVQPIIDHAVDMALGSARLAAMKWRESYRQLHLRFPALPPLPELWERLCNPGSYPGTPFPVRHARGGLVRRKLVPRDSRGHTCGCHCLRHLR